MILLHLEKRGRPEILPKALANNIEECVLGLNYLIYNYKESLACLFAVSHRQIGHSFSHVVRHAG